MVCSKQRKKKFTVEREFIIVHYHYHRLMFHIRVDFRSETVQFYTCVTMVQKSQKFSSFLKNKNIYNGLSFEILVTHPVYFV